MLQPARFWQVRDTSNYIGIFVAEAITYLATPKLYTREPGLAGPSPVLRLLVQLDAAAVLCILRECLTGWDALDSELMLALGRSAPAEGASRSATQVLKPSCMPAASALAALSFVR